MKSHAKKKNLPDGTMNGRVWKGGRKTYKERFYWNGEADYALNNLPNSIAALGKNRLTNGSD